MRLCAFAIACAFTVAPAAAGGFVDAALSRGSIVALARDVSGAALSRGSIVALARDDGRYANEPLREWFDQLASERGLCCSFADGRAIADVDWDTQDGRYRVRLNGEWLVVPDAAVVKEPNKYGRAVVWPYMDANGATQIRCFLPGAGA
jgi:hypothetical protein